MADRPIIFSAPMVRALLEGRKTQTRRVLKPQPVRDNGALGVEDKAGRWVFCANTERGFAEGLPRSRFKMPYTPGDRLWVREAFSYETLDVDRDGFMLPWYWADGNPTSGDFTRPKPSIHMPRWASRLTLLVTDVRVQRLQEISEDDARSEGIERLKSGRGFYDATKSHGAVQAGHYFTYAKSAFETLWNSIHGPDAWDANPWVAAISFAVQRGNIDR